MKTSLYLCASVALTISAHARVCNHDAVRAILGEAAGEPYAAKLAVACAIRNRGKLDGVYGARVTDAWISAQPAATRRDADKAWRESAHLHGTGGDVSEGCAFFGCPGDADYFQHVLYYHPVRTVGTITFYKP